MSRSFWPGLVSYRLFVLILWPLSIVVTARIAIRADTPPAIQAYGEARDEFTKIAQEAMIVNDAPVHWPIPDRLANLGVIIIESQQGCVAFTFSSHVTDAIPSLLYSADPRRLKDWFSTRGYALYDLRHIEGNWRYIAEN